MSIAVTTALAIGGIAAGVGGAAIASHGANKAADTQAQAAKDAGQLQYESQQNALAEQKRQYDIGQANLKPWLEAGTGALNNLQGMKPFSAPTGVDETNDPGYQFRLQEGQKAIERSAASRGSLLTGGTAKSLEDYAQGSASNEYGNVYNRALSAYQQNENTQLSLAGLGQNSTSQANQLGANFANNSANIDLTGGAQQAQQVNNAAAARASGYAGSANAWSSVPGTIGTSLSQILAAHARPTNYGLPLGPGFGSGGPLESVGAI